MDIRNIGNNGNVERSGDRPKRAESQRGSDAPSIVRDEAKISAGSRETAAAVEALAERARKDGPDREIMITVAMTKLMGGDLDGPAVHAETAQRVLGAKFLTA